MQTATHWRRAVVDSSVQRRRCSYHFSASSSRGFLPGSPRLPASKTDELDGRRHCASRTTSSPRWQRSRNADARRHVPSRVHGGARWRGEEWMSVPRVPARAARVTQPLDTAWAPASSRLLQTRAVTQTVSPGRPGAQELAATAHLPCWAAL